MNFTCELKPKEDSNITPRFVALTDLNKMKYEPD